MGDFYIGDGERRGDTMLPTPPDKVMSNPRCYRPDPGLISAVNVALMLGQPLLLTGEPGAGKTQLAYSLAWEMDLDLVEFATRSTTTFQDLFYDFDSLSFFHEAQIKQEDASPWRFIQPKALGIALIRACKDEDVVALLREKLEDRIDPVDIKTPDGKGTSGARRPAAGRKRMVVLLDEIDKAPRDFTNDILRAMETMRFTIHETTPHVVVEADKAHKPILILTSNSEKPLPDAFLRRCVYYDVALDLTKLPEIARGYLASWTGNESLRGEASDDPALLTACLDFFTDLRKQNLEKKPSTAEFLGWLYVLWKENSDLAMTLSARKPARVEKSLATLAKTAEDRKRIIAIWKKLNR